MNLLDCVESLEEFSYGGLTARLSDIEAKLPNREGPDCLDLNAQFGVSTDLLDAAATVKRAALQINVLIHAIGILHLLPHILEKGEKVEYVSLGAGNTGRKFDLETDRQIAEFTFIAWRGGSEAIRQNKVFVDFFHLAEEDTSKIRNLFVLGTDQPRRFLEGRRKLSSVLQKQPDVEERLHSKYGHSFSLVCDYYTHQAQRVNLCDVSEYVPHSLKAT